MDGFRLPFRRQFVRNIECASRPLGNAGALRILFLQQVQPSCTDRLVNAPSIHQPEMGKSAALWVNGGLSELELVRPVGFVIVRGRMTDIARGLFVRARPGMSSLEIVSAAVRAIVADAAGADRQLRRLILFRLIVVGGLSGGNLCVGTSVTRRTGSTMSSNGESPWHFPGKHRKVAAGEDGFLVDIHAADTAYTYLSKTKLPEPILGLYPWFVNGKQGI